MAKKKASKADGKVPWICNECGAEYEAGKQSYECPVCGETMNIEILNVDGLSRKSVREAIVGGIDVNLKKSDDLDDDLKTAMLNDQFKNVLTETIQDQRLARVKTLGTIAKTEQLEAEEKLENLKNKRNKNTDEDEENGGMQMPMFGGQNVFQQMGDMSEEARKDLLDRFEKNPYMAYMFAAGNNPNAKMSMQGQMPGMMGMNPMMGMMPGMMPGMNPMMGMQMPQQEEKSEDNGTNKMGETVAMMKMMMDMIKSNTPPPPVQSDHSETAALAEKFDKMTETIIAQRMEAVQNTPQAADDRVVQIVNSAIERTVAPLVQQKSLPEQMKEILTIKEAFKEIGLVSDPQDGVVRNLELEEKKLELDWKKQDRIDEKAAAERMMQLEIAKVQEENDLFTSIIGSVAPPDENGGNGKANIPKKTKGSSKAVVM